jgi:hypothetical protein
MAAKLTGLTQNIVILRNLVAESCTTCHSVLVVTLGTSGYAFILEEQQHVV